jgi:hypothetical protein
MAKERRYYYECLATCQMGYMASDHRRERWADDGTPAICLHERTFYPAGLGKKRADYLVTDEPISKRYTDPVMRTFKKMDLRTREIITVNAPMTVKFRLLDQEEVGDYIREHARFMKLRDCDTIISDPKGNFVQKDISIPKEDTYALQE